jgi:hypothetical protein
VFPVAYRQVRQRLRVYSEVTAPLSDFYAAAGLLRRIEATGEVAEVIRVLWPRSICHASPTAAVRTTDGRAAMQPGSCRDRPGSDG